MAKNFFGKAKLIKVVVNQGLHIIYRRKNCKEKYKETRFCFYFLKKDTAPQIGRPK